MIVIYGNGQTGVADAWLRGDFGDGCACRPLPPDLVDPPTAADQSHVLAGLHVLPHRRSAVPQAMRDTADAAASVPLHQNLLHICHHDPPAPHRPPPPFVAAMVVGIYSGPVVANSDEQTPGQF